jgi:hypothetical protein
MGERLVPVKNNNASIERIGGKTRNKPLITFIQQKSLAPVGSEMNAVLFPCSLWIQTPAE